ncbi:MAG: helix-turn-helix domain-containing protein [Rhodanobacter sp.]
MTEHALLAYQRYMRVLDARRRLASGSSNVTTVAFVTGYAGASQLSREYKKTFGVSPIVDSGLLRQ